MWIARTAAIWLVIIGVEIVHGIVRGLWLVPLVGWQRSNQIGVFTGSLLFLLVALALARWLGVRQAGRLFAVGALWVALTLIFEFTFGPLVLGLPVSAVAAEFDLAAGGLMPIGLAFLLLTPWLAARLRGLR
jgi:hypothetical protein